MLVPSAWPHPGNLPYCLLRLACAAVLLVALSGLSPARAEVIRVSAVADQAAPPVQARQQAQDRALAEAVFQTAQRLLPAPLAGERALALRRHLALRSVDYVLSFQEPAQPKALQPEAKPEAKTEARPQNVSGPLELDVEVDRAALREHLLRLGLLAGDKHPRVFTLRLGPGVTDQDVQALDEALLLTGLARASQGPADVTLERLAQGAFKGVLRHAGSTYVADSRDLPALWLDLWGQLFAGRDARPGGGARPVQVAGFSSVDAVSDFTRVLASWDEAVADVQLVSVDIRPGGISARWSARIVSQERLDARLLEHLPTRKLKAVR